MSCLLDTGATSSILHPNRYHALPEESRPRLEGEAGSLEVADGSFVASHGSAVFTLEVGGQRINQRFVVADLVSPAILGMDFMKANLAFVDVCEAHIWLNGARVSCLPQKDGSSMFKVSLMDTVTIPPLSETIIEAEVRGAPTYTCALIEPCEKFVSKKRVLLAKTVVDPCGKTIPLRLVNLEDRPVTLYRKTVAGTCTPVTEVEQSVTDRVAGIVHGEPEGGVPPHLCQMWEKVKGGLTAEQQGKAQEILTKYKQTFATSKEDIGRTHLVQHKIPTGDARPVRQNPRRLPFSKREDCAREVQRMLEMGVITPSVSPWASPVVMVKKSDGSWRFCVDYRKVNNVTKKDSYPLPRIDDTLDALSGSKWFSTVDLASGYWQVEMDPSDAEKTAFCTTGGGLFQWNVLPFGLTSAGATFERLMERVLAGLHWEICLVYLDDVIIHAPDFVTHIERLDAVLARIGQAGLKISPNKCQLFQHQVEFLGHIVSETGIATSPGKTETVRNWPTPKSVRELRSFLGLCSYYRRFVKGFADIAKPLHKLTELEREFLWTSECQSAFEVLKETLVTAPVLGFPDTGKPFTLDTDASGVGLGAVLSQEHDGVECVIAYYSRCLSKEERRYCVTRRELLAVVASVRHFHHYVYGVPTKVRTDHGALSWLLRFKNPEGQMARWLEILGEYNLKIQHRAGRLHGNADALSRRPCDQCRYCDLKESKHEEAGNAIRIRMVNRPIREDKPVGDAAWMEGWPNQQVIDWQGDDPVISKILSWKEVADKPQWSVVKNEGSLIRNCWTLWSELEIHEGLLYRHCSLDGEPEKHLRLVAPSPMRREILRQLHANRTAGHFGVRKTAFNVRRRFWWPGLAADVATWCKECKPCQFRNRRGGRRHHNLTQDPVGSPMERMAVDIVSFPTETNSGNTCAVVISDYFTKWTEAFALPNHQAMTVADTLVTEVFMRLGVPRVLHSDQGPEFRSDLMRSVCELLEIKPSKTAPYHPQSDGQVERFNRTLIAMLSKLCLENKDDWDDHLPYVMCAYRSTMQESTGYSPNRMMLGREITLPMDLMYPIPDSDLPYNCPIEYVEWVREAMEGGFEHARNHLAKAAERQKRNYDARAQKRSFKVGDWVLRFYHPNVTRDKLNAPYTGPFLIVKIVGEVDYRIQKNARATPFTVHVDDLKLYHGPDTPDPWLQRDECQEQPDAGTSEIPVAGTSEIPVAGTSEIPTAGTSEIPISLPDTPVGHPPLVPHQWEGSVRRGDSIIPDLAESFDSDTMNQPVPDHGTHPHDKGEEKPPRLSVRRRAPPNRFGWDEDET